jgi:putative ABC transport system permease protein
MESMVMSLLSGIFSLILYQLLHPTFGRLLKHKSSVVNGRHACILDLVGGGVLIIGLLAGLYPALFQAVVVPLILWWGNQSLSRALSFFPVCSCLLNLPLLLLFSSAQLFLSRQVTYFLERDLGYNESHVVIVNSVPRLWDEAGFQKMDAAKAGLQQSAKIKSVTLHGCSQLGIGGGFEDIVYKSGLLKTQASNHTLLVPMKVLMKCTN